jgi:hypothetical protein
MMNNFDEFDQHIGPEELQCDNPIEEDFEAYYDPRDDEDSRSLMQDEGSDRDNWEDEQVFQDNEW